MVEIALNFFKKMLIFNRVFRGINKEEFLQKWYEWV